MAITCRESVETAHCINFDAIGNVDIRLHRFVDIPAKPTQSFRP